MPSFLIMHTQIFHMYLSDFNYGFIYYITQNTVQYPGSSFLMLFFNSLKPYLISEYCLSLFLCVFEFPSSIVTLLTFVDLCRRSQCVNHTLVCPFYSQLCYFQLLLSPLFFFYSSTSADDALFLVPRYQVQPPM